MAKTPKKYMTVGQIDATGIKGPHEKELEDISKSKNHLFINLDKDKLKRLVEDEIGGIIENIGFSEDWTISVEMFPEVNIHMAYTYYGDEFGDGIEAGFKFSTHHDTVGKCWNKCTTDTVIQFSNGWSCSIHFFNIYYHFFR